MKSSPFRLRCLALSVLTTTLTFAQPGQAQDAFGAPSMSGVQYETRLSSIEDQMRQLTGRLEQLDFAVRRLDQTLQRAQTDYEGRLTKLEAAPPPAAPPPQPTTPAPTVSAPEPTAHPTTNITEGASGPSQHVGDTAGTLGELKMQGEKITGSAIKPKSPPLPSTPPDFGLTAQEQYDRAFALLRQASYDEAEKAFKSFMDKNPKDKLLDNAKYWYAETFYVRGKFGDAAVAFAEAFEQNAKGSKAPDSLLKLAMSLSSLNKTQDACATLGALKAKFPKAPATVRTRAEQEKTRLKCPG